MSSVQIPSVVPYDMIPYIYDTNICTPQARAVCLGQPDDLHLREAATILTFSDEIRTETQADVSDPVLVVSPSLESMVVWRGDERTNTITCLRSKTKRLFREKVKHPFASKVDS